MRISSITVTSRSKKPAPTRRLELGGLPSIPSFFSLLFLFCFSFFTLLVRLLLLLLLLLVFLPFFIFPGRPHTHNERFPATGLQYNPLYTFSLSISPFTIRFSIVYGEKFFFVFFLSGTRNEHRITQGFPLRRRLDNSTYERTNTKSIETEKHILPPFFPPRTVSNTKPTLRVKGRRVNYGTIWTLRLSRIHLKKRKWSGSISRWTFDGG